jgi:hypothetical protein
VIAGAIVKVLVSPFWTVGAARYENVSPQFAWYVRWTADLLLIEQSVPAALVVIAFAAWHARHANSIWGPVIALVLLAPRALLIGDALFCRLVPRRYALGARSRALAALGPATTDRPGSDA